MEQQLLPLLYSGMGIELIYSFVIILCSLMIYHATKEMYELSNYKGIRYFRQAFLFFAAAYFFRYFIKFFFILFNLNEVFEFSPSYIMFLSIFIMLYLSLIAILYLLYSVMWKEWIRKGIRIWMLHLGAVLVALLMILLRRGWESIVLNAVLLISASVMLYLAYKHSRNKQKGRNLYTIYLLLFIFWILNVVELLIPRFMHLFQLLVYLASILVFMLILYKVVRKSGD